MAGFEVWLFNQAPVIVVLVLLAWSIIYSNKLHTDGHLKDVEAGYEKTIVQLEKRVAAAEQNAALWRDIALPAVATARRAVDVASSGVPLPPQGSQGT